MSDNKKHAGKAASARTPKSHDWMEPVDPAAPCGADLEYDPEFVVLSAKAAPRAEAQYGDFVGSPEPVNWSDVDRDCRRLMTRSKDMRLAVLFTRCRTRLAGATGLAEGAGLLAAWLAMFPDAIHPQPDVDADRDAALEIRKNALQALTDADGLLADVREIALTRSTAIRLQVRDVERAFAQPRPGDALAPESVVRQLDELQAQQPAILAGFGEALASVGAIDAWSREHLGEYAPDLSVLAALLRHVAGRSAHSVGADPAAAPADAPADAPSTRKGGRTQADESSPALGGGAAARVAGSVGHGAIATPADRHAARELIRQAREWFEQHEPSSPIPVLLRRAEYFVGKRYAEVVQAIPVELLAQWGGDEP
ncbi:type VI secretion protein ImpA [Burkholderia mayonis]|uniref:Type VI secretion protein ImpA n=2 Tax=Burkholderia mayonis TaxID=1385591 RepID=A0A1B4FTB7_9BURK|nr:type VI secretion system ImpA family N-terminal domain-containing protein [Burkholderia mayonis]AOJ06922.1 type VI secretion protein ImpA [Burkholderia mayonis]KVE59003.1 type VI secretion protein ImpA [Burkholderia mayonis]